MWNVKMCALKISLGEIEAGKEIPDKTTVLPKITGRKVTKTIPIGRVLAPKDESRIGYSGQGEESEKQEETIVQ